MGYAVGRPHKSGIAVWVLLPLLFSAYGRLLAVKILSPGRWEPLSVLDSVAFPLDPPLLESNPKVNPEGNQLLRDPAG